MPKENLMKSVNVEVFFGKELRATYTIRWPVFSPPALGDWDWLYKKIFEAAEGQLKTDMFEHRVVGVEFFSPEHQQWFPFLGNLKPGRSYRLYFEPLRWITWEKIVVTLDLDKMIQKTIKLSLPAIGEPDFFWLWPKLLEVAAGDANLARMFFAKYSYGTVNGCRIGTDNFVDGDKVELFFSTF